MISVTITNNGDGPIMLTRYLPGSNDDVSVEYLQPGESKIVDYPVQVTEQWQA